MRRLQAGPVASFEVACRPYSWGVFGLYMRFHTPSQADGGNPAAHAKAPDAARDLGGFEQLMAEEAIHAAGELKPFLGQSRLWLLASGPQLVSPDFLHRLLDCMTRGRVDPRALGIELGRAVMIRGANQVRRSIAALRASGLGVGLAGAGPQDLDRLALRRGDVDCLRTPHAPECAPAAAGAPLALPAWVERAHSLGMAVIAGGVESRRVAADLGEAGFAAVAGPVVSPPMTLAQLSRFLGKPEAGQGRMRADSI